MIAGLLCIGLALLSSALKNTQHELGDRLQTDLLGAGGFLPWAGAIMAIGAIGYIPGLKPASHGLLLLIGVVMVVRNGGVFQQAQQALIAASAAGPAPSVAPPAAASASSSTASGSSSSGGGLLGTVASVASIADLF